MSYAHPQLAGNLGRHGTCWLVDIMQPMVAWSVLLLGWDSPLLADVGSFGSYVQSYSTCIFVLMAENRMYISSPVFRVTSDFRGSESLNAWPLGVHTGALDSSM